MTFITRTNFNATKKSNRLSLRLACRRCGAIYCTCSEDELDAGGPT